MLISSHYFYTKSSSTNIEELSNSYRERSEVYYTRNLGSAGNIRYDVTAPFFNLIDIKATYSRFSKTIFSIAENCEGSLYRKMLAFCNRDKDAGEDVTNNDIIICQPQPFVIWKYVEICIKACYLIETNAMKNRWSSNFRRSLKELQITGLVAMTTMTISVMKSNFYHSILYPNFWRKYQMRSWKSSSRNLL